MGAGADGGDDRAAQTALALVDNRVLSGRDRALRAVEENTHGAVGERLQACRLLGLAVAHLDAGA